MANGLNEFSIEKVFLMLGQNCNFKCKYCIQSSMNKITQKTISKDVYKYLEHLRDIRPSRYDKLSIVFYGGEPLLYWDIIKIIVNKYGNDFNYGIITNGKLLNKENIEFINKNSITITLSNDGINTDKTRGINLLENNKFRDLFNSINNRSIDSVLSAYNYDIEQLRNYIDNKCGDIPIGKEMLRITWDMPKDLYNFDLDEFEKLITNSANLAYNDILCGNFTDRVSFFYPVLNKIANKLYDTDRANCGQVNSVMNIDLDGNVYVCHNSNIKIGTVNDTRQALLDKYRKWLKSQTASKCYECEYYVLCKGACPLELHTKDNDKKMCAIYKIYYKVAIDLANRLNNSFEELDIEV